MKRGHQWIHFDAHYPHGLGQDISDRFGAAGQLVFVQFLCACKRSFPQGQIKYRTDDEAIILLGAYFPLVDNHGDKWWLDDLWKWLRYRRVVSTSRRAGTRMVSACHWDAWEMSAAKQTHADQMRRWRTEKRVTSEIDVSHECGAEVGGGRLEVGGGSVRGDRSRGGNPRPLANSTDELVEKLMHRKSKTKDDKP